MYAVTGNWSSTDAKNAIENAKDGGRDVVVFNMDKADVTNVGYIGKWLKANEYGYKIDPTMDRITVYLKNEAPKEIETGTIKDNVIRRIYMDCFTCQEDMICDNDVNESHTRIDFLKCQKCGSTAEIVYDSRKGFKTEVKWKR